MSLLSSETEERRLYNRAFKTGFCVSVLVFALLNVIAYLVALRKYQAYVEPEILFAPVGRRFPRWGFPFVWDGDNFGFIEDGLVLILLPLWFAVLSYAFCLDFSIGSYRLELS